MSILWNCSRLSKAVVYGHERWYGGTQTVPDMNATDVEDQLKGPKLR